MKHMLMEVYNTTKKMSGIDPSKPGESFQQLLVNDDAFNIYVEGLAESIEGKEDQMVFKSLAENTRVNLLENSMFQINPFETLTMPILRVFYPKLVAKEAVTVSPMDKPETIKAFIKAKFLQSNVADAAANWLNAPAQRDDVSRGQGFGTLIGNTLDISGLDETGWNVLGEATSVNTGNPLSSDEAHLERDFTIISVSDDGTVFTNVGVTIPADSDVAVEGHFSFAVTVGAGDDVLSGKVDYLNGILHIATATGNVVYIQYSVTASLEENKINPKVNLSVEKLRLNARDRQISANWTVNMEQDMRALFDVSMQAEIVNVLGQQIALDIDREIINNLISGNTRLNLEATHQADFYRLPPTTFTWGEKYWHENIIPRLNTLSAQIYTDSNINSANTILANPLDVSILEDLQTFNYTGTSTQDGDLGYRSATVQGGKWRVLTSAVVPAGQMILIYKPQEELKMTYLYCPYVPAVLHPYPLGATPSLTILSRYATSFVRPEGVAVLNIKEGVQP